MATHRHLEIMDVGDVTVVRLTDRKVVDETNIQELGRELFGLVEEDQRKNLLLNFAAVGF
jgi:anti-sigma B factor antagonist